MRRADLAALVCGSIALDDALAETAEADLVLPDRSGKEIRFLHPLVAEHLVTQEGELSEAAIAWLARNARDLATEAPSAAVALIERVLATQWLDPPVRERLRVILAWSLFRLSRLPDVFVDQVLTTATDPVHVAELRQLLEPARSPRNEADGNVRLSEPA